ncbi:hypothetical protein [uncultured Prevotella sp.]|uniref:hypothetical protein n=1 Tax=uncultured Prevotella sp. TaxID=159272 RepID=UPI0027E2305C|nr:hypothetical protein [uncultured Prevotella sp.]
MKKLLTKFSLVLLCSMAIVSCKTNYYQVYSIDTDGAKQVDNSLVFENEDCRVSYNLWSNNGKISFAFSNKTDKDIFINFGQTFFIKNGLAVDYFQARTYSEQSHVQSSYSNETSNFISKANSIWKNNIYNEDASVVGKVSSRRTVNTNSFAVTSKEKEIVCIPANCYKVFSYYSADPSRIITCDKNKDFPSDKALIADYNKQNSPLVFVNRIAYGFNKNEVTDKHMENTFWISSIMNYSQNAATEMVYGEQICSKNNKSSKNNRGYSTNLDRTRQFKIGGPNKFYKFYKKY